MGPNLKDDELAETWYYAWHRTPTLRERIGALLSTGPVLLALGIIAMLAIALILGWS
jgi:hypothetical protein